jgi:DNA phosphorothioation-dependent restriction protein DptH
MSVKQFEEYLVNLLLASSKEVLSGHRYQFKSPDFENTERLFDAFASHFNHVIDTDNDVSLSGIKFHHTVLIPVVHNEEVKSEKGFSENFISYLRDEVSGQTGVFKDTSLLIIHNSMLDTLINSAKDLTQNTEIWSVERLEKDLKKMLESASKHQELYEVLLENQSKLIQEEGNTIFGYSSIFESMSSGTIKFEALGLFKDSTLISMNESKAQIQNRIEKNSQLFDEINFEVEHFPNQLNDRLKLFSEKFIETYFNDEQDWKHQELQVFLEEQDKNKTQVLTLEKIIQGDDVSLTSRAQSNSQSGKRKNHLILEVDPNSTTFSFKASFTGVDDVKKSQFSIKPNKAANALEGAVISVVNTSKQTNLTFKAPFNNQVQYFRLLLKRENVYENFDFYCLVVPKGTLFVEGIKNHYTIDVSKQRITLKTQDNKLQLCEETEQKSEIIIVDSGQVIDTSQTAYVDYENLANSVDQVGFTIESNAHQINFNIEGAVGTESISLPFVMDQNRYDKLFDDDFYAELHSEKGRISFENNEYTVVATALKLLRLEEEFVQQNLLALDEKSNLALLSVEAIDIRIFRAYQALYKYLRSRNTTISLVSWGSEFVGLVNDVVTSIIHYFNSIDTGRNLTDEEKIVLQIGSVKRNSERFLSPFHPIILSYYLTLVNKISNDESYKDLPSVTFNRLVPKGLLPFIYDSVHDFSYNLTVKENSFWVKTEPYEHSELSYVRKLAFEKISEFVESYQLLFKGKHANIIINAVNQEQAKTLLLGIGDFVRANLLTAPAIHVNFYDEAFVRNAFDDFSESSNFEQIKQLLELDKGKAKDYADQVIDFLRTKLTYSKFTHEQLKNDSQAYSHLTFFRNNKKVEVVPDDIKAFASGIACDGLLPGEASESDGASYYTGFGLRNTESQKFPHLEMAKHIGSLMMPATKANTKYNGTNAIALAVDEGFVDFLQKSYESSIWTTIIDPKVTLEFFHKKSDVILIHYSDQYTSSASYDAITVTSKTELFQEVLGRDEQGGLIEEFNAFNGDWLLKMITCADTIRKERKGIIGAYKYISGLLKDSGMTWVPISVAEMIRVSGNLGLKMSESDFAKQLHGGNKGKISDDILFVGLKDQKMYLLPVEVKTGATPDYAKAIEQAKELKRYLKDELLSLESFAGQIYRSLFMRQVLMQIEKYQLYKVFSDRYFDEVMSTKEEWLRGHYHTGKLVNYPQGFVVSHLDSATCFEPNFAISDDILKVNLPISLLKNLVSKPMQTLLEGDESFGIFRTPELYRMKRLNWQLLSDKNIADTDLVINDPVEPFEPTPLPKAAEPEGGFVTDKEPLKVQFGSNSMNHQPIIWEPTNTAKVLNTNTGIIGTMGTGKTQFTKSLIAQLQRNQHNNVLSTPIGILIFDYKNDYTKEDFVEATNAKVLSPELLPFNPLALFGDKPRLPAHTGNLLKTTLSKAFGLGVVQQANLNRIINEAYLRAGISKSDPATWTKPAPTLRDVWEIYSTQEKVTIDSLYAALSKLVDEFEVFEPNTEDTTSLYDFIDGVTVIKLSGYDEDIQNLVVAITLDIFYTQMHIKGSSELDGDYRQISKMVLVDEADNFMSQDFESLKKILKEGREFGVGTILSTQQLTHFKTSEDNYANYIQSWIVHQVSTIKSSDITSIFNISNKQEAEYLMEQIRTLDKHYSIYVDGDKKMTKMRDLAFWELFQVSM